MPDRVDAFTGENTAFGAPAYRRAANLLPIAPVSPTSSKSHDSRQLDALTGGAFTAPTSGERAARIRDWLAGNPDVDLMQEVFKELSGKDKGAAKPLREKLDEIRRARTQEAMATEWAAKANALLALPKLNIADALAWQRDAAKAGAPLSREPLAGLKSALAERVRGIEDLQNQVQVQREAAVLLAQRIEVLSTKSWHDAQGALDVLRVDVAHWQRQADAMALDASWPSVDVKYPPQLDASRVQLLGVWEAFQAALTQAIAAAQDPAAPLPSVPVWADELRTARGVPPDAAERAPSRLARPKVDPEVRAQATQAVQAVLGKLEAEIAEGHGKASAGAATALRNALKEHGALIGDKLDARVHAALAAAGELEGWQRWRADQLREELVGKAEALLNRPEGQALGGRKMQETLRALREQWKATDQGGVPNHALWKRFDEACNEAHKVVEAWLEKIKAESAEHRAQRLALIDELKAWTQRNVERTEPHEWKAFSRAVHQFADRWRDSGHLSEKAFAELQPLWKDALDAARAPLVTAQNESVQRRQAMIEEAVALGAAPMLRIDAIKALQQRWQAEAQSVPLERKFEQKLWDSFRQPIDDAFNRKTAEREGAAAALSERDRTVLDAAKALEAANASGDAQQIRAAMAALDAALRGQAQAAADVARAGPAVASQLADSEQKQELSPVESSNIATENVASEGVKNAASEDAPQEAASADEAAAPPAPPAPPKAAPKPVVAMRGDDRPGMKKAEPAAAGRGGKPGDRRDGPRGGPSRPGDNKFEPRRDDRAPGRGTGGRFGDRPALEDRGPRLGDAAFRAQREALEHAEQTLRKLAAQAHGESLTRLLAAWVQRDADTMPSPQELGRAVTPAVRAAWAKAVGTAPQGDASEALLRLEMAAETPTPAEHLDARRALQLKLLTRRHDPTPAQTWGQDTATVLASAHDDARARRLQTALKALLRS